MGGVGSGRPQAHAHCRAQARGLRAPRRRQEGGVSCVSLRCGDCGIVADGSRASEALNPTATPGNPADVGRGLCGGSSPWLLCASAQHCGLCGLWRTFSPTGLCFAAGRWPQETGAASPLRACAGLATPLTSFSPESGLAPTSPAVSDPRPHPAGADPELDLGARGLPPRRPENACASPGPSVCASVTPRRPPPPRTGPLSRAGFAGSGAGGAPR